MILFLHASGGCSRLVCIVLSVLCFLSVLNEYRETLNEVIPWSILGIFEVVIVIITFKMFEIGVCDFGVEGGSDIVRMDYTEPSFEVGTDVGLELEGLNGEEIVELESGGSHCIGLSGVCV